MRFRKWAIVSLAIAASLPALVAFGCSSFSSDASPDATDKDDATADVTLPDASTTDGEGPDGAPDADADAPYVPRLRCNALTAAGGCSVGSQVCCIATNYNINQHNWSCVDAGSGDCPSAYVKAPCDDSEDCAALGLPATVCCATYKRDDAGPFSFTRVECLAVQSCTGAPNTWVLCDPTQADAGCPDGGKCTSLGGGFAHCD